MDTIYNAVSKAVNWLFEPTTVSFMQDGENTISNLGFGFMVFVTALVVAVCVSPKLRKMFF